MAAQDLGPLDWRVAIVDSGGRPTPEFQRRWNTQRNNNALIGSITFGSGAPTGTPDDGDEYIDTSVTPFVFYVGNNGSWNQIGAIKFTDLEDSPGTYTGMANKIVRVNGTANGLVFGVLAGTDIPILVVGFSLGSGATGTNVATPALAPRAGSFTRCKFVTKASDTTVDLTFDILRNGTSIFTSKPTVVHNTAAGTVSSFTLFTTSPLTIAIDDVFTLNITSGTSVWQGLIQLES